MPTPTRVFAEVAARHGGVDPRDAEAIQEWFEKILPTLPGPQAEAILEELMAAEGLEEERAGSRRYPDRAAIPALAEALPASEPLLAALWWALLSRLRRPLPRGPRDRGASPTS
jgi:hypothetical protein